MVLARVPETRYRSFWVEELQISPVEQNKMESVEELLRALLRALEAARAETAASRAAAEGADMAPRGNESGDAGEVGSAYRATYDGGYAGTRTDGHAGANARQGASTANFFWGGKNRPVPKILKMKMKPRCSICVLGPIWMAWVWGTHWTTRSFLSL